MNGIRFYLEFSDPSKRQSGGNVVAALVLNGTYWSSGGWCYEALAALFDRPNAPVAGTGVALAYLRLKCRRISEAKARAIHPVLFTRLDPRRPPGFSSATGGCLVSPTNASPTWLGSPSRAVFAPRFGARATPGRSMRGITRTNLNQKNRKERNLWD
jgi:hypothetical protein